MENPGKPTVLVTGAGIGIGAATARYITGQVLVVDGGLLVGRY